MHKFSRINFQGKKFLRSRVIAKLNARKLNGRKYYFDIERVNDGTGARTGGFRADVCVRGQHIDKDIWYVVVGEVLVCEREPNNFQDIML